MTLLHTEKPKTINKRADLAARIDHTLLTISPAESIEYQIEHLCEQAKLNGFRAVCVRPRYVKMAADFLAGSPVRIASVIAFPEKKVDLGTQIEAPTFGDMPLEAKIEEIRNAIADGASELDVVMNIREFRESSAQVKEDSPIQYELTRLVEAANGVPIKLIIETDLLVDEEIAKATNAAISSGVDMIKTSTGMLEKGQGATAEKIKLIFETIQQSPSSRKPGIKASGGIRTLEQAVKLFQAGADIIGTSAGESILAELEETE